MQASTTNEAPIFTFSEAECLSMLATSAPDRVPLPFLPAEPRRDVAASGLASLVRNGDIATTDDGIAWSKTAAAVAGDINSVSRWIEIVLTSAESRSVSFFGASTSGNVRLLVSAVTFGAFQFAPLKTDRDVVDLGLSLVTGILESVPGGEVALASAGTTLRLARDAAGLAVIVSDEQRSPISTDSLRSSISQLLARD